MKRIRVLTAACAVALPLLCVAHNDNVLAVRLLTHIAPESAESAGDCRAITDLVNHLMAFRAATCQAHDGVVQIRATPEVRRRDQMTGFYVYALFGAGWSVNSEVYHEEARFIVGNDTQLGCMQIDGRSAAAEHAIYRRTGADFKRGAVEMFGLARRVSCPAYLR